MFHVVTSAEIYHEADPDHAVAVVTRKGGDKYHVKVYDTDWRTTPKVTLGPTPLKISEDESADPENEKYYPSFDDALAAIQVKE